MPDVSINYLGVVLGAVASMAIGALWYSPALFANVWMKEVGKKMDELKGGAGAGYFWMTIASLVTSYVMAHFVDYTLADTAMAGATTGLWVGIGFVATAFIGSHVFEGKSWTLWAINAGYQVVNFAVMGAILAVMQ